MKLIYVADGRSPTALNWIAYFIEVGEEVHLVSTFPCEPLPGLASFRVVPVAMSQSQAQGGALGRSSWLRRTIPVGIRTRIRQWLGPLTLSRSASILRIAIEEIQPDIVHAMRIPYEGMLASLAYEQDEESRLHGKQTPLIVSIWGNDFTLHASSTKWMKKHTSRTLIQANALHTDCWRDHRLALEWGFDGEKPAIVLPGGGGIRTQLFNPGESHNALHHPVVINPRGFRAYVRNDTFFKAIPLVLSHVPKARFLCPAMSEEPHAKNWVMEYGITQSVELLPFLTKQEMAGLYQKSQVAVSVTTHDGTPNTLLEALACGCFPVVGNLESLREWITDGENGFLVDPGNASDLAEKIILAISRPELLKQASEINIRLIHERAEYGKVMSTARDFYQSLLSP